MRDSGVKLVTTLDALPANIPENDFDRSNRNIMYRIETANSQIGCGTCDL